MYSALYPVPRIIYSMASDGLIFKPFAQVLPKIKSPWIATLTTGIISGFKRWENYLIKAYSLWFCYIKGILAAILDLSQLVDMIAIGTLMAYTFVSVCVLILRYRPDEYNEMIKEKDQENHLDRFKQSRSLPKVIFKSLFNPDENKPTLFTSRLANIFIFLCSNILIC